MNIVYNDVSYNVLITKKNNKNLYIRVDDDLNIKVTCPYFYTNKMVLKTLNDNALCIYKMIDKQKAKNEMKKACCYCYLGKTLNVIYTPVIKPDFNDNTIIIKDDLMLLNWYKKQAQNVFKTYLDDIYLKFEEKIPYPKLKIRNMKTRWGVCNRRDNSVTLNLELIKKDDKFLYYVIIHELSHFVHFNHGKGFWKLVEKYCPEYKMIRKKLKE